MGKLTVDMIEAYFHELIKYGDRINMDENFVRELIAEHLVYLPKKKLYKFRECSEQNFSALENNCIWMSDANSFPDNFDCTINIDFKENIKEIEEWLYDNYLRYYFEYIRQFCASKGIALPYTYCDIIEYIDNCMTKDGGIIKDKEVSYLKSHINPNELPLFDVSYMKLIEARNQMNERVTPLANQFLDAINASRTLVRKKQLMYCMTERHNNPSLWEVYADKYSGFCIEYNFDEFEKKPFEIYKNLLYLFPMIYRKRKPYFDIVPFMDVAMREYVFHDEKLERDPKLQVSLNMQLLYKNKDYEYEHEWRFSIKNNENNLQPFPFVSALYVGQKISTENLIRLKEIAYSLRVPVFQQEINKANNGFEYSLIKEESK